jgi:acetylornithine deacetylase/succinyl-diaminopimelate desuccinylase-like protein
MTKHLEQALEYARSHRPQFESELADFVRIPSVSTAPEAIPDMQRAAEWCAAQLRSLGMTGVQIMPTAGHPVVFGELRQAGPAAPTVLLYGHYDVQPAEPLELWHSGAFEPEVRGENMYGRGVSDMKGQDMVFLKAVEAIVRTGEMPINLKVLIEGEEEIGSPSLGAFIAANAALLKSDVCLNLDSGMIGAEIPTISYGLRGLAYFELRLSGPKQDLHSGLFGGVVHNPAQVLCELVAGMHDAQGRITLPGYYDRVAPIEAEERAELARSPMDDAFYLQQTGAPQLFGEAGYISAERVGARPTLEINGLFSGFTGEGSKTVLPAKAMAKISMRLVPHQDPLEVEEQLRQYIEKNAPPTVRWEVIRHAGGPASITDRHLPAVQAFAAALEAVWGKRPIFKREGGSVPVVGQMHQYLGIDSVLGGFGLPDDNLHAPNEKLHLPTFHRGIEAVIHFLFILNGSI